MQAYEISKNEHVQPVFAGDLRGVRHQLRTVAKDSRDYVRIYLVEFPTDKASLVALLNGQEQQRARRRAWRLSIRGRLIEIPVDAE